MKVQPYGYRVLIKPFLKQDLEKKSSSGIILLETEGKEKSEQGIVLESSFKTVKKGDKVVFSRYGYESIKIEGDELYLIEEKNILAILT